MTFIYEDMGPFICVVKCNDIFVLSVSGYKMNFNNNEHVKYGLFLCFILSKIRLCEAK